MGTDNRNNGNNRNNTNRSSGRTDRYRYTDGHNSDSGHKSVRKVENTRFYERENPESNMRRVGRTAADFKEEQRTYSPRTTLQDDSIPEFKSFRRTSHSDGSPSARSSETRRYSGRDNYSESRSTYETDPDMRKKRNSGNLYSSSRRDEEFDNEIKDSDDNSVKKERIPVAERLSKKREDKKRRAEVISRSDDRSYRRRAVSRKRDRRIRSEQLVKAAVCILIIFVVLLITLTKCDYDDPYATSYVTPGTIEFMSDAKAYFIREEVTCEAESTGILVAAVNEGDKVAKESVIAYITTEDRTGLIAELQEIEDKIETIQKLSDSSNNVLSDDIIALDDQIAVLSRDLAVVSAQGNMTKYNEIKNEIDSLMMKRNELVNDSQSDSNSLISSLLAERDLIKERINIYTKPVKAKEAGVVSFYIDGNENAFTEYNNVLSENSSSDVVNIASLNLASSGKNMINANVAAGSVVAKIITSYDYYVAAVTDGTVNVQKDRALSVKSKDRSFATEIDVVSVSHSSGKTLIVGKTDTALVSSLGERVVNADVITGKYDGMKIPLSSLTEFDSNGTTARLTLVRSNYVVYAYINILAKDSEYAIISDKSTFSDAVIKDKDGNIVDIEKDKGVSVNDIFVLKPEFVEEGDLIS